MVKEVIIMEVQTFKFPKLVENSAKDVELTFCKLINAYRNGDPLTPEMIDWMDGANTWLESCR